MNFHLNNLCRLLHIEYPMIQAGMAGGPTTPELVSAVSNAGALGTLAAAYLTPSEIRSAVRAIKASTNKPFAVNIFCAEMSDETNSWQEVHVILNRMRKKLGLPEKWKVEETINHVSEQFQVIIEEGVPIISTAFGTLPEKQMIMAKENGVKIISMVTTVREAIKAEQGGADIIVAQGSDAGGHRGTFDLRDHPNGANIGTFSLLPQVVDAVNVPVVAAGGIMDGRGVIAALALGAAGVQLGTAFLTVKESGAHPVYKKELLASTEESTVITKVFSGRPARGIKNTFIEEFEKNKINPMSFPAQNTATGDIRKEAAKQNNPEYMSLWAGQGTRLLTDHLSASDLIKKIIKEAEGIVKNITSSY